MASKVSPSEAIYKPYALNAASKYGVDGSVFANLIASESSWNPAAYNASGAAGLAQFMPGTAKEMGVDPYNPYQALDGSAKYLSTLLKKYGNYTDAIAAYKGYGNNLKAGADRALGVLKGTDFFPTTSGGNSDTAQAITDRKAAEAAQAIKDEKGIEDDYGFMTPVVAFFQDIGLASIFFVLGFFLLVFALYSLAKEHDLIPQNLPMAIPV